MTASPIEEPTLVRLSPTKTLRLPAPRRVPADAPYVRTPDRLFEKCLAAWDTYDGDGQPLAFRLVGDPGVGKNALVDALAVERKQPLYVLLGHEELTPEDLVVTASIDGGGGLEYTASPLLAAMLTGGICFLDEIAKMRPRALAPLASLLDGRRRLDSVLLGHTFEADPAFRFCAAHNPTDADAFDLAPWLRRRTLPEIEVRAPDWASLTAIVRARLPDHAELARRVEEFARERRLPAPDTGTLMRLVAYARRLGSLPPDADGPVIACPMETAFRHVVGRSGTPPRRGKEARGS